MKWVVVHFMDEDSVEAVPDTWHRKHDLTCAWPFNKHSIKRYIEKRVYPNDLEFQWLSPISKEHLDEVIVSHIIY